MTTYPPTPPPISGDANRACRALIDVLRRQIGDRRHHDVRSTVSTLLDWYVEEGHSRLAALDAIVSMLSQGILQPESVHGCILEIAIVSGEGNDPQPSVSTSAKPYLEQVKFRIGERLADWARYNRSEEFDKTIQHLNGTQARAIVQHLWDGQRRQATDGQRNVYITSAVVEAAFTIATIPDFTASGSRDHVSTTRRRSGSSNG